VKGMQHMPLMALWCRICHGIQTPQTTRLRLLLAPVVSGFQVLACNAGPSYQSQLLALADMPKPETSLRLDFSSFIGPLFFVWLVQLPLPWAVVQLVYEKQHRLRIMMRMHGLSNGSALQNCCCSAVHATCRWHCLTQP
jgi:hypothetical protein